MIHFNESVKPMGIAASAVVTTAIAVGIHILHAKKTNGLCNSTLVVPNDEHYFSDELLSTSLYKVFLFSFPRSPHVRNISPFALKVESFLRMHSIPFESVGTFKFSPTKGQMPYIRLNCRENGSLIADSNFIIQFLSKKLGIDAYEKTLLTTEQTATSHAFTCMIEEHTTQIGFYYRYVLDMDGFCTAVLPNGWFRSWFTSKLFRLVMPMVFKKKSKYVSFGRHSDEEKWIISCQDIQSISDYLGEKRFMFGDEPTTLDCTLFGHFAQFLYIPLDFPQKIYIHENCDNIVKYMNRFKELYWKDWDA